MGVETTSQSAVLAPHSVEAEEATVGAVLINPACYRELQFLQPEDFYIYRNHLVWAAIGALYSSNAAIDNLTVTDYLRGKRQLQEVGGSAYMAHLVNETPTSTNAAVYARIVQAFAIKRGWIDCGASIANIAYNENDTIQNLQIEIDGLYQTAMSRIHGRGIVTGNAVMSDVWDDFWEWVGQPAEVRGMSCGIQKLDRMMMGFRPGLYAIGGASSMGKSTFAGALVRQFAAQGRGVFVPTEVEARRAFAKIAGDWAGIPYKKLLSGMLNETEQRAFQDAFAKLSEVSPNITVFDSVGPSPMEIQAEAIRTGAKWVIIDSGTAIAYQYQEKLKDLRRATSWLSQSFQNIARLGIAVVVFWQIGRSTKDRQQKWPTIHDFKESGAIEENADVCLGLYRHDYYVARQMATPDPQFPPGTGTVFVLKDRDGGDGSDRVTIKFMQGKGFFEVATEHVDLNQL